MPVRQPVHQIRVWHHCRNSRMKVRLDSSASIWALSLAMPSSS